MWKEKTQLSQYQDNYGENLKTLLEIHKRNLGWTKNLKAKLQNLERKLLERNVRHKWIGKNFFERLSRANHKEKIRWNESH